LITERLPSIWDINRDEGQRSIMWSSSLSDPG
jgi:hypothetical protein